MAVRRPAHVDSSAARARRRRARLRSLVRGRVGAAPTLAPAGAVRARIAVPPAARRVGEDVWGHGGQDAYRGFGCGYVLEDSEVHLGCGGRERRCGEFLQLDAVYMLT